MPAGPGCAICRIGTNTDREVQGRTIAKIEPSITHLTSCR